MTSGPGTPPAIATAGRAASRISPSTTCVTSIGRMVASIERLPTTDPAADGTPELGGELVRDQQRVPFGR